MSERLNQLKQFQTEDPNDPFIVFAIAKEYEKLDNLQIALDHYLKLYESHSDYIGVYYHLGMLYEKLEQYTDAQRIYSEGLVVAKNTSDFHSASELNNAKMNLELLMD